ncbi:DUF5925 domain-containing protein [Mycobacterium sp. UM_CSW]|uniref:DUF5925 domain-containing protein n=1 Tax=Mycobacterium sp. UM_CSW TaxID=1370119 RepID=UPI0004034484|nr:DUF5925 domain-containing protein [Mycobacterium sp. UM_CSW]
MSTRKLPSHISQLILTDYRVKPESVVYAAFNQSQLDGSQPYVARRIIRTSATLDVLALVPEHLQVSRRVSSRGTEVLLFSGDAETVFLEYATEQRLEVYVSASDHNHATAIANQITSRIPEAAPPKDTVGVTVWHSGARGASPSLKSIRVPSWADIRRNYPGAVAEPLNDLFTTVRPHGYGKLILWHGEPGTGKTTALRALSREWKDWCSIDYVADPERLFFDTGYLLEVIAKTSSDELQDSNTARWRLLIAEDSDEFLRVSARREAGAALGRLLNLSDGILGQGSNTLILLTTNERLDRLHPAVVRPGRCLAQVEFTRFPAAEANRWLPENHARVSEPKTLAELIEHRDATKQIATGIAPVTNIGAYL